jgi:glycerol-3-phosphate acyltransferase PlsY
MLIYLLSVLVALVLAFLCGSIPVALIIGKSMRGLDVRQHGSGNAGSTNAIRVLGTGPGLLVFAGDVFKGALGSVIVSLAVGVSLSWIAAESAPSAMTLAQGANDVPMALSLVATVLGHMFSPFMGFKGGKGVATALGSIGVVLPLTAACSLGVFILVVLLTRYVSLGSILAVVTVPIFTALFYDSPTYLVLTVVVTLVVVWAHRKNIARLRRGEEPRFSFSRKRGSAASPSDSQANGQSNSQSGGTKNGGEGSTKGGGVAP